MFQQSPDEQARRRALARWEGAGDGPGTLAIGSATWSNTSRVARALADLGVAMPAMPLLDGDGRVAAPLAAADVLVSGGTQLTGPIFDQLACRVLLRPYVGYNDIDVPAATARGILVCNVPDAYSEEVAMQAIAFLMAANRQLVPYDREVRAGRWRAQQGQPPLVLHNSRTQTVGVVGFGRIGRISGTRARALGFRVIATDPFVKEEEVAALGIPLVPLEQLLGEADYVTIHALLWEGTHHLINAERLALMKPGAWLINTARGPIVDEAALIAALRSGHLGGAGLDVVETEPIDADNPLLGMPNVVFSPHSAVYSEEGQVRAAERTAEIARDAVRGRLPDRAAAIHKGLYDALAAAGAGRR
ncbi:MAG TPA: C-terminal binding protein [Thermomicrobiales bacterium]|nr:C-terminal binding protein [Thermomicrobiales bacterium]